MRGRKQCDSASGCGKFYPVGTEYCPYCKASVAFSEFVPYNPLDWTYDLETYPNIFTADFKHLATGTRLLFEISDRKNEINELYSFLYSLSNTGCRLVGFNNVGYDYPMLHFIITYYHIGLTCTDIYNKNEEIINTPWANRYNNVVWDSDVHIIQIDLYKIHHFDNDARRTSLKMIEFNMRMDSIEDLPFPPGTTLNHAEKDILISYNDHDVDATEEFLIESLEMIEFREQLGKKYDRNFLNHSDKKIGTDIFIIELEKDIPGSCYTYESGKRQVRQTIRSYIKLDEVIFPYINFKEPEFERVKNWLSAQTLTETKGVFTDLSATVQGFTYDFGTGGLHGSIESSTVVSDSEYVIIDVDVAGFYPELGAVNKLYPEHLSTAFCDVNENLKQERAKHKKGTALNDSVKKARNCVYGDSNNKYSAFFDSKYTMSITINGQLLLCMLAQYLIDIPGLKMIQVNTDGLTVRLPRKHVDDLNTVCKWWEDYTCLELEQAIYSRMFIRDVNNYIAEYEGGKLKSKGAYVYKTKQSQGADWTPADMDWHQNYSALVVPKCAEAALVHGQDIADFIYNHDNIFDFMLRTKVGRADDLILTIPEYGFKHDTEITLQKITRYYISNGPDAGTLTKISPPTKGHGVGQWKRSNKLTDQFYRGVLAELRAADPEIPFGYELDATGLPWDERINTKSRTKYGIRRTSINSGWLVKPCNDIRIARREDIDFDYYIAEVKKLVNPLR